MMIRRLSNRLLYDAPFAVVMLGIVAVSAIVVLGVAVLIGLTWPTPHHPCMEVYQQATGLVKVYCER